MDSITQKHFRSIATLSSVLAILTIGSQLQFDIDNSIALEHQAWSAQLGSTRGYNRTLRTAAKATTPQERIAQRLQKRLHKRGNRISPPLSKLVSAVHQRQQLLGRHFDVTFTEQSGDELATWDVSLQRYPQWITADFSLTSASFTVSPLQVQQTLQREDVVAVQPPTHAVLKNVQWKEGDDDVTRVEIEGIATSGFLLEADTVSNTVASTFSSDDEQVSIVLEHKPGRLINMTGLDLGNLELWAQGKSNFKGSTYARQKNVRKALEQHVTNTVVMPNETFSFNSTLGGRVTQGNGWHMAKVIYNGADLEYAPGGGICQASTTVFRAIVNAGFPVIERRAHSLYVSYYEEYGVGMDATIYPGSQDLVFLNDSENPLVIQAYSDGYDAYVNFFGTPDNRVVEVEGPYFAATAPEGVTYNGRAIKSNEIVWFQHVTYADGTTRDNAYSSRYNGLPQHLAAKHPPVEKVHAAAPLASVSQ